MRKLFYLLTAAVVLNSSATLPLKSHQDGDPLWLRYPTISPDGTQIAFTYKGDIYKVDRQGGEAVRLTFHQAHDFMPVWSPDSKYLSFASDRFGNFDVFIMDANGGEAQRLTLHSSDEFPYRFTPAGDHVLFGGVRQDLASHRQYPSGAQPELYQVPANGGRIDLVLTTPAEHIDISSDGTKILYHDKKGVENEWRKHHQSSIARDIWIFDKTTETHTQLTDFYGEDRHPIFSNDEKDFYYLSEESGTFNIHRKSLENTSASTQLTQFKKHPIRSLSLSNQNDLCFSYDGAIYTMRVGEQPEKLKVSIRTQSSVNSESYVSINGGVQEMSISPNGKEIAFIARGEVFVTSVDGKFTKRLTNTAEQERFVSFAPDGKSVVYAREQEGRWQIFSAKVSRAEEPFFFAATLINEELLVGNEKDNYMPSISPDGKWLAFIEDRRSLKIRNISSGEERLLLSPAELFHMQDGDQYFRWSPDSKWLLASIRPTMANAEVMLVDIRGNKPPINLTKSGYNDIKPTWADTGSQILWFSNRDGLKSHATSGSSQLDVYSLFLTKESWEKFNLDKDEFALLKELEKLKKPSEQSTSNTSANSNRSKNKTKEETITNDSASAKTIEIDFDGLDDRKAKLTLHSASLSDAVLSKDGEKLFYLARFEKGFNLWSTNLRTKETKMEIPLDGGSGSLAWDREQKNLYLLSGGRITKINPDNNKRDAVQIAGELILDTDAERQHAFEHVWLRTKKVFYTPDMHGVDWDDMKVEYSKYLPHIGNNYEFAELLSELLGELNVSHAGARYSSTIDQADATASLGIFLDYDHKDDGIKISEVIKGGPLDRSNFNIPSGSIIEKIDGVIVSKSQDYARYLNRKSGVFTLLDIKKPDGTFEQITVKPISLGQEGQLLYKRWVRKNQEDVERLSQGKLGYVHIPGMNDGQYRNVYDEMMGKYADRHAMIIDTRFNGGGDLVADLAMFFTGEKFLDYATADRSVGYEPTFRWTKPTLALFNEANYSDGHCFSCTYTDLGIGKTVGMPVPGTCSFAGWEMLPNGIRWGTVPISAKNKAGEWLENNETRPQFIVKNQPSTIAKGRDQQLEKAIEELLKDI